MESGLPHKFTLTVASGVFDIRLGWEATIDTQYDFGVTVDNHRVRCGALWSGAIYIINDFSTCVSGSLSSVEKQFYLLFRFCLTLCVCSYVRVCACVCVVFVSTYYLLCVAN